MNAKLFILVFFCVGCYQVSAQDAKTIRVKAGEIPEKVVPVKDKFRYSEFKPGSVLYISDKSSPGKLNYNHLLNEVQMITPKGDTFSLANENAIKQVTIGEDIFYYDPENGYMEIIADYTPVKLAVKRIIAVIRSERTGGYGQSSGVSSIRSINTYSGSNSQVFKLQSTGDLVLSKETSYFVIDQNNRFHLATRPNVLKVFAKDKSAVEKYIKANRINFNKEEDLKKLLQFCAELT